MKKYGFYLLAFVCSLNFFAACSDDDGDDNNNGPDPEWSDYVATFSTDNVLTVNGIVNDKEDVKVVLAKGANDNAKLTLENIVIESATVEIDNVEMKEEANGTYTFTANQSIAESVITVSGILTPGEVTKATGSTPVALELTVTRKVTSDLVGEWKLDMNRPFSLTPTVKEGVGQEIEGAWAMIAGIINNQLVNPALTAKIDGVTVNFNESGTFSFSWLPKGESNYKTLADIEIPLIADELDNIKFEYYVNDGVVSVGFDREFLDVISMVGMFPQLEGYLDLIDLAMGFLRVQGNYALLPLPVSHTEDGSTAFSLTVPAAALDGDILEMLLPLISQLPQFPQELLQQFPQLISALDSLTVQLNFK
ncbi:MAG: calycin-like domain-containing protein [Tannerellaceae bacterium]|nr:calycin-like domain-containing protein [Tannerellaceae bacterium]